MSDILRMGDIGQAVADLQADLRRAGYDVERTAIYDGPTRDAVAVLQAAAGLVVDGVYGPKSRAALANFDISRLMRETDLIAAADRLGVPLASIKAVNEVESRGRGFLNDGRPVILYERHVFWKQLVAHGVDPARYTERTSILSRRRGGYAGGAAEYVRLASAMQIHTVAAQESASWGAFQVMGYHWKALGFADIESFVATQHRSEGDQLATFTAFVLADTALHRALKAAKWAQFARLYNGPAYAENLYDIKLARAYARFAGEGSEVAA